MNEITRFGHQRAGGVAWWTGCILLARVKKKKRTITTRKIRIIEPLLSGETKVPQSLIYPAYFANQLPIPGGLSRSLSGQETMKSKGLSPEMKADSTSVTSPSSASASGSSSQKKKDSIFPLNAPVWIQRKGLPLTQGQIAYMGQVDFAQGSDWIGVRLTGPSEGHGKNDGSVHGRHYFSCPKKCGLFVRQSCVSLRDTPPEPTNKQESSRAAVLRKNSTRQRQSRQKRIQPRTESRPRRNPYHSRSPLPEELEEPPSPFVGLTIEVSTPLPHPEEEEARAEEKPVQEPVYYGDGWSLNAPILAPSSLERDIRYYSLTTCSSHASDLPLEDQNLDQPKTQGRRNITTTRSYKPAGMQSTEMQEAFLEFDDDDDQSTIPSLDDDDVIAQDWHSPTWATSGHGREPLSSVRVVSPNIVYNEQNHHSKPFKRSMSPLPPPVMSPDKLERIAQRDRLQALEAWKKQKKQLRPGKQQSTNSRTKKSPAAVRV